MPRTLKPPPPTPNYTLAIVETPFPKRGDSINFTGTFPSAAFRQARNTQFHNNPYLYVTVTQGNQSAIVASLNSYFTKGSKNPDGSFDGTTAGPVTLDGIGWDATQPAQATAVSGYWTDKRTGGVTWNQVAFLIFSIPASA